MTKSINVKIKTFHRTAKIFLLGEMPNFIASMVEFSYEPACRCRVIISSHDETTIHTRWLVRVIRFEISLDNRLACFGLRLPIRECIAAL